MQNNNHLISLYNRDEAPLRLALTYSNLSHKEIISLGEKDMRKRIRNFTQILFEKLLTEKRFPVYQNPLINRISYEASLLAPLKLKKPNDHLTDPKIIYALAHYRYAQGENPGFIIHNIMARLPGSNIDSVTFELLLTVGGYIRAFDSLKTFDPAQRTCFFRKLLNTLFEMDRSETAFQMFLKAQDYGVTLTQLLELYIASISGCNPFPSHKMLQNIQILIQKGFSKNPEDASEGLYNTVKMLLNKRCSYAAGQVAEMIQDDFYFVRAARILDLLSLQQGYWVDRAKIPVLNLLDRPINLYKSLIKGLENSSRQTEYYMLIIFLTKTTPDDSLNKLEHTLCEVTRKLIKNNLQLSEQFFSFIKTPLAQIYVAATYYINHKNDREKQVKWESIIRGLLTFLPQENDLLADLLFNEINHAILWDSALCLPKVIRALGTKKEQLECDQALAKTLNRLLDEDHVEPAEEIVDNFSHKQWKVYGSKKLLEHYDQIPGEEKKSMEWFARHVVYLRYNTQLMIPIPPKATLPRRTHEPADDELFNKPSSR